MSAQINSHAAPITDFSQYDSSPGGRAYYHAGHAVSSSAEAETIASTYCAYTRRTARLSGLDEYWDDTDLPKVVTNTSTNQVLCSLTLLM